MHTQTSESMTTSEAPGTSNTTEHQEEDRSTQSTNDASSQLTELWEKNDTEVVVSVVPSQIRGNSYIIHHSELLSLRPHNWLTGEVNFDDYKAIVSFVNIENMHWKFLYINAAESCVYSIDPSKNSAEQEESDLAANKFSLSPAMPPLPESGLFLFHIGLLYLVSIQLTGGICPARPLRCVATDGTPSWCPHSAPLFTGHSAVT
ncbi:hypothetical protein Q8A67_006537 [Cirrhinus molitorella]|uniref:Uncharacterized protein n=1 Tax=Cirrhinus molitorella TaxID=172907 RepID=A0AA88U1D0_9TELE|nr:hypothetical protein Q8A67_006537 [Cirrhinus molitorella]